MSTENLTPMQIRINLNNDARKIADLIRTMRDVSFASLCPAGRAEVGAALAGLIRAERACADQIKRHEAACIAAYGSP